LWKILLREENKRKGGSWLKRFNDAESGKLTQQTDDPLINIAMVWGINSKKDKTKFNLLAKRSNTNWEVFASIACSELANSATLENIRDRCQSVPEQGYILRIIARNPNASTDTIRKIAEDDKIGIYSIVARKRMAEGLDSAIKRCS
jgi:hypothetical protein